MHIIHDDLQLKCLKRRRAQELTAANCLARLSCSKQLLRKYLPAEVDFIFFTDEKVFTVVPPVNLQIDRVYALITVNCKFCVHDLQILRAIFAHSAHILRNISTRFFLCYNVCDTGVLSRVSWLVGHLS